jgi:hypothetical protein
MLPPQQFRSIEVALQSPFIHTFFVPEHVVIAVCCANLEVLRVG